MKRRIEAGWILPATILLLCGARVTIADRNGNLIENAGFEEEKIAPWHFTDAEIDKTVSHQGKQSVRITGTGAGMQMVLCNPVGGLRVEPASRYRLALWMRLQKGDGRFTVRVRQMKGKDYAGVESDFLPANAAEWRECAYEFVTSTATDNIFLDWYFFNTKGTAYVDDISLTKTASLTPVTSEQLTEEMRKRLAADGWRTRQDGGVLVVDKEGLRSYYRIIRGKQYLIPEEWRKEAFMGSEVDRLDYHMTHFPIGPALYGYALFERAKQLGMDKWEYVARVLDDIRAHHMNTIWYGNTGTDKADIDRMICLAEEKGLTLLLQMSGAYYRCTEKDYCDDPEKRRRHFEEVNVPFVRDVMPKYRNRKGIFAWSVKEETRAEYAKELAAYYKLVMELDPTHPVLICHNNLEAAENMEPPYPSILGFDRYYYRASLSGGGYLRTPALAISLLGEELPPFYQASLRYRVPFFYAIQAVASYSTNVDFSREGTLGANMEKRGWRPDTAENRWAGWLRYYPPEHCTKLQCWTAVALGAKGIFAYCYGEPSWGKVKPGTAKQAEYALASNTDGEPAPQWEEFGETAKDLLHFAPLILSMNKRIVNVASAEDPNILTSTFREEGSDRTYLIVVNRRTGSWCKDSPKWLKPEDELRVDDRGNLVDYSPAPPLDFALKVETASDLYDLRALKKVDVLSAIAGQKSYKITLPPGEGNIFLLGNDNDFAECRQTFFRK